MRTRIVKTSSGIRAVTWTAATSATAIDLHAGAFALGAIVVKEIFDLLRTRSHRMTTLTLLHATRPGTYLDVAPSADNPGITIQITTPVPDGAHNQEAKSVPNESATGRAADAPLDPEQFFIEHRDELFRYAVAYSRNSADAEDAVSHAVASSWQHYKDSGHMCPPNRDPVAYMKTAVRNYILDRSRRSKTRKALEHMFRPQPVGDIADEVVDAIMGEASAQLVKDFISSLSGQAHMIAIMYWGEGKNQKEIAKELRIKEGSVRTSLSKTRGKLRKRIGISINPEITYGKEVS